MHHKWRDMLKWNFALTCMLFVTQSFDESNHLQTRGESNQIIFENAASVSEPEPESQIIYLKKKNNNK